MNALTRLAAMPRQKRLAGALAAVAVAMAISACGSSSSSDSTIPQATADQLISALNGIQDAVDKRQCNLATQQARDFVDAVGNLPDSVTPDDKAKLLKAGQNLEAQAQDPQQCKPEVTTGPSGETGLEPTSTTTSTPEVPTTSETTTSSTTTTTTTTQPEPTGGGEGNGGAPPPSSGGGGETGGGGGEVGGGSGGTGGTGTGGTGGTGGGTG